MKESDIEQWMVICIDIAPNYPDGRTNYSAAKTIHRYDIPRRMFDKWNGFLTGGLPGINANTLETMFLSPTVFMRAYEVKDIYMRMLCVDKELKVIPSDYKLLGTRKDRKKFVGNSLVPMVMQKIVERLIKSDF